LNYYSLFISEFRKFSPCKRIGLESLFFLLLSFTIYSQPVSKEDAVNYTVFDLHVGIENTGLYNGNEFRDIFGRNKKIGNRFYKDKPFFPCQITYNGQLYSDQQLLYDIVSDNVILYTQNKAINYLQLNSNGIDKFSLDNHNFIRISTSVNSIDTGFYEILYDNSSFVLLKKNKKKVIDIIKDNNIYFKFSEDHKYYIFYQNEYYRLKGKKDILKVFPKIKKTIKSLASYSASIKNAGSDNYWIRVLNDSVQLKENF